MRALSSPIVDLMRASSCLLSSSTRARICAISPSRPESLASMTLSRALASSVALRADSMFSRTVSERLRRTLGRMRKRGMPIASTMMAKLIPSKIRAAVSTSRPSNLAIVFTTGACR